MPVALPARHHGPLRVVLLYGGASAEHEISCRSARTVFAALTADDRHEVEVVGIGTDGRWVLAGGAARALDPSAAALPEPDQLLATGATEISPPAAVAPTAGTPTVVWPVLHGPMGEDGTVQGLLEVAGVPYVGASVAGSAAAMDKGLAKTAFAGARIPQARWFGVRASAVADETGVAGLATRIGADLGWPAYLKPANMGSSVGVHRVDGPDDLAAAVADASGYDEHLVVEERIVGRELEVGVLGIDPLLVSKPGEIVPTAGTYTYDDKYVDGTADLRIPAELPEDVVDEMGVLAVEACRALRVDCMARVDFFLEEATGRLLVNEINTLPGFTSISMYPALWAASGVPVPQLAATLCALALQRHTARRRRTDH